ncbi:hypothetical protein [Methylobacterium pseudosasicola]|nr:hypothetical protein [Methylobacterium pseudosasicola]
MSGYLQSTGADATIWSVYKVPGLVLFDPDRRLIQVAGQGRLFLTYGPEWREIPAPPGAPTGPVPPIGDAQSPGHEPGSAEDPDAAPSATPR